MTKEQPASGIWTFVFGIWTFGSGIVLGIALAIPVIRISGSGGASMTFLPLLGVTLGALSSVFFFISCFFLIYGGYLYILNGD